MNIAVIGATGTAGSRVVARLREKGVDVVEVSRSAGVDVISGAGLYEALAGVDVVIDASNAFPADDSLGLHDALTAATRNIVETSAAQGVGLVVLLSIIGIEQPVFDDFPYYVAKRAQERIVAEAPVRSVIVKTSQWHEFALNPAAVTPDADAVAVADWLVQPIAADTVADVLVECAITGGTGADDDGEGTAVRLVTGPERIRLPELTRRLLARLGDPRPVHVVAPRVPELAEGALVAPPEADVLGPTVAEWLAGQAPAT